MIAGAILAVEGVAALGGLGLTGYDIGKEVYEARHAQKSDTIKINKPNEKETENWEYVLQNTGPVDDEDWGHTVVTNTEIKELPPIKPTPQPQVHTKNVGGPLDRATPMQRNQNKDEITDKPSNTTLYVLASSLAVAGVLLFYYKF